MAIKVINSQGTRVFIVDVPATEWADCDAATTAILAGKMVGCPQSLGDLTETRPPTEYKCLSSNETAKILGAISRGSIDIGLLLDPDDAAGQGALRDAFHANENKIIGIVLPNEPEKVAGTPASDGNGTIYWFEGGVSETSVKIEMDAAILYSVKIEISSDITECPAVAGKIG